MASGCHKSLLYQTQLPVDKFRQSLQTNHGNAAHHKIKLELTVKVEIFMQNLNKKICGGSKNAKIVTPMNMDGFCSLLKLLKLFQRS